MRHKARDSNHSRLQSLRSFWPAAGIESSGSNHFRYAPQIHTALNRMGRIRLFPLLFQKGCSQSSRFLPPARRIVGSGDENVCSWERHFILKVPLFTQVYKWVPANAGGNPAMDQHPIHGGVKILSVALCYRNWDKLRPDGLFQARMQT